MSVCDDHLMNGSSQCDQQCPAPHIPPCHKYHSEQFDESKECAVEGHQRESSRYKKGTFWLLQEHEIHPKNKNQ